MISGVVVATENEETVREVRATHLISISPDPDPVVQAYWEAEHVAAQKEQDKRHQAVIKRWTKLVHGLRIRQRMREQYGTAPTVPDHPPVDDSDGADQDELHGAGGFLTGAGDVVQPYNLPRPTHVVFSSPPRSPAPDDNRTPPPTLVPEPEFEPALLDDEDEDDATAPRDSDLDSDVRSAEELQANGNGNSENRGMPKSMAELAAEAEAAAMAQMSIEPNENADVLSVAPSRRRAAVLPKANGEVKAERGRGRKRARAHDSGSEDEDEWQSDDGDEVDEDGGRGTRNAKRPRPRARRVQRTALAVPVPTSDRVLRARKK